MSRKIALVTGANKGIGHEVARRLAMMDHFVWLGCRDRQRGEQASAVLAAEGLRTHLVMLDVTDRESVNAAAAQIARRTDQLDVLVNNAGVALGVNLPTEEPEANLRRIFETNVLGAIRVTQAMSGLLRRAPAARVVMVSSRLGSLTRASDPENPFYGLNAMGYASSKAALNAATVAFAKEFAHTPIKINAADPGFTATDINGHRGKQTVEQGAHIVVRLATLGDDGPTGGFFNEAGPLPW